MGLTCRILGLVIDTCQYTFTFQTSRVSESKPANKCSFFFIATFSACTGASLSTETAKGLVDWLRIQQASQIVLSKFTRLIAAVGLPLLDTLDRSESFDQVELMVVVVAGWVASVWSGMGKRRDRRHKYRVTSFKVSQKACRLRSDRGRR